MKTIVLKFGGTSVGSINRIKKIAQIILKYKRKRNNVVIISSAMSGATNNLIKMSKLISRKNFDIVIASRFKLGGKVKGLSSFRILLSIGAKFIFNLSLISENQTMSRPGP